MTPAEQIDDQIATTINRFRQAASERILGEDHDHYVKLIDMVEATWRLLGRRPSNSPGACATELVAARGLSALMPLLRPLDPLADPEEVARAREARSAARKADMARRMKERGVRSPNLSPDRALQPPPVSKPMNAPAVQMSLFGDQS